MKIWIETIVVTFSMYSKIPMPQVAWNDRNMRFSFLVLPMVGAVIGTVLYALISLFQAYALSPILFAAAAVAASVLITGGLHMDGFCDTSDALSSRKEPEEKLRILQDPHVGAFSVIHTVTLFLLQFGAWHQIYLAPNAVWIVYISFVLSRALIAYAVLSFPRARNTGLASSLEGYAAKKIVKFLLLVYLVLCAIGIIFIHIHLGIIVLSAVALSYWWFYRLAMKNFGGITGDLAGFYLVICETGILFLTAVAGGIGQ